MKKFMVFLMLLLAFAWGVLVATLLFQFGVVQAQEGCGRWVEVRRADGSRGLDSVRVDGSKRSCTYWMFVHPNDLPPPDSVWVPGECSRDYDWRREYRRMVDSADMVWEDWTFVDSADSIYYHGLPADTVLNAIMDTVRHDWNLIPYIEEYERYRCREIWECVRQKLIEFLEERER